MLKDCRKCGSAFSNLQQEENLLGFCSACWGDEVDSQLAWDDGNHDELHEVCSCWSPTPPEVDKESSGVLNYSEIETKDSNTDKRRFSMDLQSLLENLNSVISNGQDQLYGLEEKRNSIEDIESQIQDAVSNLEDVQGQLEDACNTLQNLEDYLIPEAENITAY